MWVNDVIVYIMVFFLCIGALDKVIGNKIGLGQSFTNAFMTMGSLTLAMVGIVSLAPVIALLLTPIIAPIYGVVGADPAAFANTILALDMGGYALAKEMALTKDAELFSWVFLGTMMGPTIVFTIPVALGIIEKEDQPYFAKGILLGVITVPIGCLIGGLVAGLDMSIIIRNLIPTIILSLFISVGLWKITDKMIKGFQYFAKGIEIIAIVGLTAIIIETLTGFVVIPNMTPLEEGIKIVGMIVIVLAGAFPLVTFINQVFTKRLRKVGALLKIDEKATAGLIASLAHVIPMLALLKEMTPRGKLFNVAFAVSGAFVLGGHLGFVAGMEKEMVFAMVTGKLISGFAALTLAYFVLKREEGKKQG
ncbi:ethanolamine utilization protein EutH [Alkalihalobacillus sp. MEB130]|uniref:ethanolamine utilization protein EutH n=1 Tax=Alkalihalobacillus sp. MEB130 TaxID=2976704 RepID=UPI0028DE72D5|nr:ethanolamine utilization protein EutH [Alkalihalobacillus sp. MEB130]MDT8859222.1 ethanolamine utilization protein EutH [Alkalihalobacillus sp. MEB130]